MPSRNWLLLSWKNVDPLGQRSADRAYPLPAGCELLAHSDPEAA